MDPLTMLIIAAVKTTITEIMYWSKDKTEDEIKERAASEEKRTSDLIDRMRGG